MKYIGGKHLAFLTIGLSAVFFGYAYASDTTFDTFPTQSASGSGSSDSIISTEFYARPSGSGAYYMNKGNNSSVIGNYFEGFYYDSVLGYFQFDWSVNENENVRIVGSTSRCSSSYGYKLGGYSYSPAFGYIDFDYDADTYVYYCEDEGFLRGYAYNVVLGHQNFEGISFNILSESDVVVVTPPEEEEFINSGTEIEDESPSGGSGDPNESEQINSNFTNTTIQNDQFEFDVKVESLFYIIK